MIDGAARGIEPADFLRIVNELAQQPERSAIVIELRRITIAVSRRERGPVVLKENVLPRGLQSVQRDTLFRRAVGSGKADSETLQSLAGISGEWPHEDPAGQVFGVVGIDIRRGDVVGRSVEDTEVILDNV